MMNRVFLDTSYVIALSQKTDNLHSRAAQLFDELLKNGTRMFTTSGVILEFGNALAKKRYRQSAIAMISALEQDPHVDIIQLSGELFDRAFNLFSKRPDKDWGIVDCVSFVVMDDHGIKEALTHDIHFEQAGFVALLR